jgi:phosphohistidine swiveling domain-containing protein
MGVEKKEQVRLWDAVPGFDLKPEIDLPEMHSWFHVAYSIPPWTPLFGWHWMTYCARGVQYAAATLSLPACKGWPLRYMNGGLYAAFYIVRDKQEIAEREGKFRDALHPWIEDFDGLWAAYKRELLETYNKLKAVDLDNATDLQLSDHHHDLKLACKRMWEIHFVPLYAANYAWLLLDQMARERFGIRDQDPAFQDMVRGFPNKVYEMDKEMWKFGKLAAELELETLFKENDPPAILNKLQQTEKGKEWFKRFMSYMETDEVGGWRMRRFSDFNEPYWLEDPATPIGLVKDYVERGSDYDLEATRAQLITRRKAAIADFMARVPPPEKDIWEGLIRLAGKASAYSEEHNLYCELMAHAFMRRGYLAMGRRLAAKGTIDVPEDIFMLNPEEIDRVIFAPEYHDMRWITRRRNAAWQEWRTRPNPPMLTERANPMEAVGMDLLPSGDAMAIKIVLGELPEAKPEVKADLWGLCGSAGEAEGTARVCFVYEDLKSIQPGDILVCPSTNAAWTPVFAIVSGVITDAGGTLCHAAIIGREYGVPTLVNTREGTTKIKSGQRIRMDANQGALFILDQ